MWLEIGLLALLIILLLKCRSFLKQTRRYIDNDLNIKDQTVIVTGATGCIGNETALQAAQRGARVILACRNMKKASAIKAEIIEKSGNTNICCREVDLSSLKSVRKFSKEILNTEEQIDILVNNAGVFACPFELTQDGFEMHFAVNYAGLFLLTLLLLPGLSKARKGRVVNVTSITYQYGEIIIDNLHTVTNYNRFSAYANSKLAVLLFTRKLAKLLKGTDITVNCTHPGIVITDIIRNLPYPDSLIYKIASKVGIWLGLFDTVEQAADNDLRCAVDKSHTHTTGGYFSLGEMQKISDKVLDARVAEELWYYTLRAVDLKGYSTHEDFMRFSKNISRE